MTKQTTRPVQSLADRKEGTSVVRVVRAANVPATVVARPSGGGAKAGEPPCARCTALRIHHEDEPPYALRADVVVWPESNASRCKGYLPGLPAPSTLRREAMKRATVVARPAPPAPRHPLPNPAGVEMDADPPWADDAPPQSAPRKATPRPTSAGAPQRSSVVDAILAGPPRGGIRTPPPSPSRMVEDATEVSPDLCGSPVVVDSELVSSLGSEDEPSSLTVEQRTRLQVKAEEAGGRGTGKTSEALFAALARLDWLEAQHGPAKRGRPASLSDQVVTVARRAIAKGVPFEGLAAKLGVDELALRRAITGLTFRVMKDPPAVVIPSTRSSLQTAKAPGKHRALVPAAANPPARPAPRKITR